MAGTVHGFQGVFLFFTFKREHVVLKEQNNREYRENNKRLKFQ